MNFKKINYAKFIEIQSKQRSTKLYQDNKKTKTQPKMKKLRYNRTQNK